MHAIAIRHKQRQIPEEMLIDWPHVTLSQIYSALAFYYANQEQIEHELKQEEEEY